MKKEENGRYTLEFRQYAVGRMKVCSNILALARELGVPRQRLYGWRERLDPDSRPKVRKFTPKDEEKFTLQQQLQQAKQLLAEKTLEVDFFKGALQKIEARSQQSSNAGVTASTSRSKR
jgi:transposase